jgi:DNA-directed RNA polymerase specialized sigma24 family protein
VHHLVAGQPGVSRNIAEDIVQDVYLKVLRQAAAGKLRTVTLSYLKTAASRLDVLRSARRELRRMEFAAQTEALEGPPERDASRALLGLSLSETERRAFTLRYVDGLAVRDVADRLGVSTRKAESLITQVRRRANRGAES